MVRKKWLASNSIRTQPMDYPPTSNDSTCQAKSEEVKLSAKIE